MAQTIISGFNAPGEMAEYGAAGVGLVLNLDATLANLGQHLSLTDEEQSLLEKIADGIITGEELPAELRAKLLQIPNTETLQSMMVHGVGDATVTATSMIEDKVGGDVRLAEMIAKHPQAEFMWGKDALQKLTAMSLRQQLAIVTKYWGGCFETAKRLAALGPENGGLSHTDSRTFQYSWDNFNRKAGRPAPNVDLILRVWGGRPPEWFALDYPLPVLSQIVLRQPQLTDFERADIQQLPARALRPLFMNIYDNASTRFNWKKTKKIERINWTGLFASNMQFISSKAVQNIRGMYSTSRYRLDGTRPLPELARAMRGYFSRSKIEVPEFLEENAPLQELAEILLSYGLGGKSLATQMRAAGTRVRPGNSLWHSIDMARRGTHPYWSDDWGLVTEYLADEKNSYLTDQELVDRGAHRRRGKLRKPVAFGPPGPVGRPRMHPRP